MYSPKDRIAAAIILVATFVIFRMSPVYMIYDSMYHMLFTQELLRHHSFSVEAHAFPQLQSRTPGQAHRRGADLPYQLVQVGERFYYYYPTANIILGLPYVALANAMGVSAIDKNGVYDAAGDRRMQKGLAPLLMAGLSAIIFLTSRLILSFRWSLLVTLAAAFGTQIWSTASRAMWTHTWGILLLGVVIWMILRTEAKQARLRPILLATCLSWLYFIRPTFGISTVAIALYVLIYHRPILLPFVLTGCIWLAAFIGFSEYHFGQLLPLYYYTYRSRQLPTFWEGLAGTLISPSRGLFIYVPVLLFVIYLLVRYRTSRPRLVIIAVLVVIAHLFLISASQGWHGGFCYGPRLSTDIVPWLALLGILAMEARLRWADQNRSHASYVRVGSELSLAGLLLVCGIMLNGIGAISLDTQKWNTLARNDREFQSQMWDWRHPQFLGMPTKDCLRE